MKSNESTTTLLKTGRLTCRHNKKLLLVNRLPAGDVDIRPREEQLEHQILGQHSDVDQIPVLAGQTLEEHGLFLNHDLLNPIVLKKGQEIG